MVSPPHLQSLLRHWCKLRYVTVGVDICTEHRRHNGNPVRCNEQRKFCKTLTIRFRASSFALVSERVLNVMSSMMVLAISELCCLRASIPLTADIGDPDTFFTSVTTPFGDWCTCPRLQTRPSTSSYSGYPCSNGCRARVFGKCICSAAYLPYALRTRDGG